MAGDCRRALTRNRTCGPLLTISLFATLVGCGSDASLSRSAVSGTVTLDGVPLAIGTICFVPIGETPGPKTSLRIEDGTFAATQKHGPVKGRHRIEIESTDTGGLQMDDEHAIERLKSQGKRRITVVQVPPWYNQSSQLEVSVMSEQSNSFAFELATKRNRRNGASRF